MRSFFVITTSPHFTVFGLFVLVFGIRRHYTLAACCYVRMAYETSLYILSSTEACSVRSLVSEYGKQFTCKFGSRFYYQTLIVGQCTLQIYIKQAMTTSKRYTKFCCSLINAGGGEERGWEVKREKRKRKGKGDNISHNQPVRIIITPIQVSSIWIFRVILQTLLSFHFFKKHN